MSTNTKQVALFISISIVVAMACFLMGFVAGNSTSHGTGHLLLASLAATFPPLVVSLIIIYVMSALLDIGTGTIKSLILGKFTSGDMRKGLWKKAANVGIIALTILVNVIFVILGLQIGTWLSVAVIIPMTAMECMSILENLGESGVPIPKALRKALMALKSKEDSEMPDLNK